MSQEPTQNDITKKRVVYQIPGMDAVTIRRDIQYDSNSEGLTMDVYLPPDCKTGARIPAVLFVSGYSDLGFQRILGCKLKEMESYVSWGKVDRRLGNGSDKLLRYRTGRRCSLSA